MKKKTNLASIIVLLILVISCYNNYQVQKISMWQKGVYNEVRWSPDSTKILVIFTPSKNLDRQIYIYHLSNKEWEFIDSIDDISYSIDWVDNENIAFERSDLDISGSALLKSALAFYNLETHKEVQLEWGSSIIDIRKNPKENALVVVREAHFNHHGIYLHDINAHTEKIIYDPPMEESVESIVWSSDGESLAFTLRKKNTLNTNGVSLYSLNILNIRNSEIKTLIEYSENTLDRISWTSSNQIIVREISDNYQINVFSITPDGNKKYLDLYGINPLQVSFSPTNKILLVTSLGVPGSNDIYLISQ